MATTCSRVRKILTRGRILKMPYHLATWVLWKRGNPLHTSIYAFVSESPFKWNVELWYTRLGNQTSQSYSNPRRRKVTCYYSSSMLRRQQPRCAPMAITQPQLLPYYLQPETGLCQDSGMVSLSQFQQGTIPNLVRSQFQLRQMSIGGTDANKQLAWMVWM